MACQEIRWDPWKQIQLNPFNCEWHYSMNCNILKFFSQNVRKNRLIVDTILETQHQFNIIFIQEPPWSIIRSIPSSNNYKGEPLVGIPHHPNRHIFTRHPTNQSNSPRVVTYINICALYLCFSLQNNVLNHRDIFCISFSNQDSIYFMLNIYSDSSQLALKYLKDTESSIVKIVDDGLYFILFFLFTFHFILLYFTLLFFLIFLFLEQLGLGFISHAVTSVTNWWHSHKTNHETWKKEVEGSGTKWRHIAWTTYAGLMLYSWLFRVGCTVASMDHEE